MSLIGNLNVFDHNTQEWQIFYGRLEQFIKLNAVADEKTGPLLLTHLSDDTYRLARNLVHPRKLESVKFIELVDELEKHFSPRRCTFADREKFFEARRAAGESIEGWAVRVRGLAVYCDFGSALDMLLVNRFVLGMNVGPERDRLFEQDATTLSFARAVDVAQQAASARQARAAAAAAVPAHVKEEPVYRVGAGAPRPGASAGREHDTRKPCAVCGMKSHGADQCRYRNYRCQACGVKGHLKKVCSDKSSKWRLHSLAADQESHDENGCQNCKECEVFNVRYVKYSPILLSVVINGIQLQMELDSGSGTTVISNKLYRQYFADLALQKCNLKFCLYNGHKISPLGYFETNVHYLNNSKEIKIYVIENGGPPLAGRDFMSKFSLGITSLNNNIDSAPRQSSSDVSQIMNEYSDLFNDELGRFNKFEVELHLKEGAVPKFFKPRPVPFALKDRVEEEINRLVGLGILVPVNFSRYGTPIVPVLKDNGKVKIAGDYSITLNKDMYIDKYPMPRIEEVLANLGNGEHYSKIDLSNAYNQFVLSPRSQELTTISTTKGLFKYTRLVYGLANAGAVFQRTMETLLAGIEGVSCWLDDVCITGPTEQVHLDRLREVLSRIKDAGLKLQKDKCVFFQKNVTYLGYVIDKSGLRPCSKKVEAIVNAPRPTNTTEVKRFLGVVNYYRKFVPNASSHLNPLHELLRDGAQWEWNEKHERAFEKVKNELASDKVLAHFDPGAQLVLTVDAGPAGLGGVLALRAPDGTERPLAFASRSLSKSQRNYSQVQKEASAIVFGVRHFHQYLYGRQVPFILRTDHRPLLSIFGKKNGVSIMAASRLQRYALFLSAYNYSIEYISSEKNVVADYFSRAVVTSCDDSQDSDSGPAGWGAADDELSLSHLRFLDSNITPIMFDDIQKATAKDKTLQTVIKYMNKGWPRKIQCSSISAYFNCKLDLEVGDGCLFRGHRIVVPAIYRERLLSELHTGHFGIVKTKSIARSRFWWPSIDKDIERYIGSCFACCRVQAAPARAPPAPWPRPAGAWQRIHIDYMSIANRDYLIVIDAFTKWLECIRMSCGVTTRALISKLKSLFSIFGIPKVIVSDNDVKIKSSEFNLFCVNNGISHITSPIYHPQSNGSAENSVKTCKKMIRCLLTEPLSDAVLDDKLLGLLFEYRNTAHCATGVSPAKLMFGRSLRSRLDLIMPSHHNINSNDSPACRKLTMGDRVWLKWYTASKYTWVTGIIRDVVGNRMYDVYVSDYDVIGRRHVDQLRKCTGIIPEDDVHVKEYKSCKSGEVSEPVRPTSPAPPALAASPAPATPASTVSPHSHSVSLSPTALPVAPDTIIGNENDGEGERGELEDEWVEAQDSAPFDPEDFRCDDIPCSDSAPPARCNDDDADAGNERSPGVRRHMLRSRSNKIDYKQYY